MMKIAVVTGGEAPPLNVLKEELLSCDILIAADSGCDVLASSEIVPDYAIGDFDSLSDQAFHSRMPENKIRVLPGDKDDSDTEAAVKWALELGAREIVIMGGAGRRMDHSLANWQLFSRTKAIKKWITAWEWSCFFEERLELEGRPGQTVSVFPCGPGPWKASSRGLKWPLDPVDFTSRSSLSNSMTTGLVSLQALCGRFWVSLPWETI